MDDDEFAKIMAGAQQFDKNATKEKNRWKRKLRGMREGPPKKTFKVRAVEARESGLSTKIPEKNIGYKMLSKMGYKEGMSLGKTFKGRVEPVGFKLRDKSLGLGREGELRRRMAMKQKLSSAVAKVQTQLRGNFRTQQAEILKRTKLRRHIVKMKACCENLDKSAGIKENPEGIWRDETEVEKLLNLPPPPPHALPKSFGSSRTHYNNELEYGIFGEPITDDYFEDDDNTGFGSGKLSIQESMVDKQLLKHATVQTLEAYLLKGIMYMRKQHRYCFWCCDKYKSDIEMEAYCPGIEEDLHDVGSLDQL